MDNLEQIIQQVQAGQTAQYEEIVKHYEPQVRSIIAAMIPDPNSIADMTQETFITAFNRISTYKCGTNFAAWLKTIARNTAQNERRRWYRRREIRDQYKTQVEQEMDDEVYRIVESLPEEVLESLRGCVEHLKDKPRNLVSGFYFKEHALKELAKTVGLSVSAAKVTLHRAREAIGKCMKRKSSL
ncbi:RNA polymerase sigma factor [Verrucomicrobiota bacterium]